MGAVLCGDQAGRISPLSHIAAAAEENYSAPPVRFWNQSARLRRFPSPSGIFSRDGWSSSFSSRSQLFSRARASSSGFGLSDGSEGMKHTSMASGMCIQLRRLIDKRLPRLCTDAFSRICLLTVACVSLGASRRTGYPACQLLRARCPGDLTGMMAVFATRYVHETY